MGFPLSREDVERHLRDLGYRNISEDQLNEFVKDLKRLIRFEEKQSRLKALIELRKKEPSKERKKEKEVSTRSSSASSGHFSSSENELPLHQHRHRHYQHHQQQQQQQSHDSFVAHRRRSISYSSDANSLSIKDESSYSASSSSSTTFCSRDEVKEDRTKPRRKNKNVEDNIRIRIDVQDGKTIDQIDFQGEKKIKEKSKIVYEQVLPKQPEFPAKATCSFIRPPPNRTIPKSDPVRLYQSYKEHWDKTKFPGDDSTSTKQLRWRVREWMMGQRE